MDEELDQLDKAYNSSGLIPLSEIPWPYNVKTYNPCEQYLPKKDEKDQG